VSPDPVDDAERLTPYDTDEVVRARAENEQQAPTDEINTPERWTLRTSIVEILYGDGAVRKERRADFVLGPPASGKSSQITEPLRARHGSLIVDADEAKEFLPEYEGGRYAGAVHQESSDIFDTILGCTVVAGDNIILPVIGRNPDRIAEWARRLQDAGFSVFVHLAELSLDKAAARSVSRFQRTGRFVDPAYVFSIGDFPSITYNRLKAEGLVHGYARYSNDVEIGEGSRLLESSGPEAALVGEE
jgi:hypothetical protein